MKTAILYIRVSTDEQANHGYSLNHQEESLKAYCHRNNIKIIGLYKEDFSAKTFDRPAWKKLLSVIKDKRGRPDLLLFTKWDRFSRNITESFATLRELGDYKVIPMAIEQPIDVNVPEQLLQLAIYLSIPEVENSRRSSNTQAGMRRARQEGRYQGRAPIGFVNKRDDSGKPTLIHSEKAALVKQAFVEISSGQYPKEVVRRKLSKQGLKISRSQFHRLLTNSVYCGLINVEANKYEEEVQVKAVFEPIVSQELFFEVQNVLLGRKKSHPKKHSARIETPLRGFLACPKCGKPLTASASKGNGGKYWYYHCQPGCTERVKSEIIHSSFMELLKNLKTPTEILEFNCDLLNELFASQKKAQQSEKAKYLDELNKNETDLKEARKLLLNNSIDADDFKEMKADIIARNRELTGLLQEADDVGTKLKEVLSVASYLLENLDVLYEKAPLELKQQLVGSIFTEKLVFQKNQYRTAKINGILALLCGQDEDLAEIKNGTDIDQSRKVAPTGIEPVS